MHPQPNPKRVLTEQTHDALVASDKLINPSYALFPRYFLPE